MNNITDKQWTELQLKICELQQRMHFMKQQFEYQLAAMENQIKRVNDMFDDSQASENDKA